MIYERTREVEIDKQLDKLEKQVVHCRDCVYWDAGTVNNLPECRLHCVYSFDGDGYCSRGKKKYDCD